MPFITTSVGGGLGQGSALNYQQNAGASVTISDVGALITGVEMMTTGKPVQISLTGEAANDTAGSWVVIQLHDSNVPIGNAIQIEASAVSENVPYALNFIHTPEAGGHDFNVKVVDKSPGTWVFGEAGGPVFNAVELTGFKGEDGSSGGGDIADFVFTSEEGQSKISLPSGKSIRIEAGENRDLSLTSGDDIYIETVGEADDIHINAADDIRFTTANDIVENERSYSWIMDSEGRLQLPGNGYIENPTDSSGDGYQNDTIKIVPDNLLNSDQYLIIDPTAPNHIHIRAGGTQDASNADIFLGAEYTNVQVSDGYKSVYVRSKQQGQSMAHLNINLTQNDYLVTNDVVTATSGWTVDVNGTSYYITDVLYDNPAQGNTTIIAPGAPFVFEGVYNVFSPVSVNQWAFDPNGYLSGPAEGYVKVYGIANPSVDTQLGIQSAYKISITGNSGEFLGDPTNPDNQIATIGDISNLNGEIVFPATGLNFLPGDNGKTFILTYDTDYANIQIGTPTGWVPEIIGWKITVIRNQTPGCNIMSNNYGKIYSSVDQAGTDNSWLRTKYSSATIIFTGVVNSVPQFIAYGDLSTTMN